MKADLCRCILLQFLIRQENVSDQLLDEVISSLPVDDENPRIRKELLIRGIISKLSEGNLTESMLDSLESLEKLDREEGLHVSASMKRAYCGVALDCTVRYLGLECARRNYSNAVDRIWRGRIRELESWNSELVTDELKAAMDDIEGADLDVKVRKRLLGKRTRRNALKWTEVYSTEALTAMGRPVLELVAERYVKKQRRVAQDGQDSRDEVLPDIFGVDAKEEVAVEKEGENVMAEPNSGEDNQKEVAGTRSGRSGLDELDEVIVVEGEKDSKGDDIAREDPILVQLPCSSHEPDEGVGKDDNIVVEDPILAQQAHSNEQQDEQMHCGVNGAEAEDLDNSLYSDGEGSTRKASETQAENSKAKLFPEVAPRSKYDTLTTPAVNKLVESLRACSSAPGKVVKDPPYALRKPKAVQLEIVQNEHESTGQAVNNEQRCTLMKPNATASAFEWDKSLDASQPRPPLDEPRREAVSSASLPKLSKRRAWTIEEEDSLRKGVAKYGRGNWKMILDNNIDVLGLRSAVDLKDKWRNMTRSPHPWLR